jgi:tricorn protease
MLKYHLLIACGLCAFEMASAQVSARLFRYPDVSKTQITFTYGGDLWIVAKDGGTASKLSSPPGAETFPKFSPDGSRVAFSGNYDGNTDIYSISSQGGIPQRLTHHGMTDRMLDWYPDGENILYVSARESGKQRFSQFYKISAEGGLPEKLPMAYGEYGSISPDGSKIAFVDRSRITRTWKRYRGGMAADMWIFDLNTLESENVTQNDGNDELPMWSGDKIYYLSDVGTNQRYNIWSYDIESGEKRQVTEFDEDDVNWPSQGPDDIIFGAGGKLYLMSLTDEKVKEVQINVITDLMAVKPRLESVEKYIQSMTIAPDGNRAIIEARGELFSLPAEKGYVQNLTRTSGVAERYPTWSPNGKYVAFWSDKSGEYELAIRDFTKGSKETQLTTLGPGFRYNLYWSPDSKKISYVDQTMTIRVFNMDFKEIDDVDQDLTLFEGGLRGWRCSWSSDSRWMAYARTLENGNGAVFIYDSNDKEVTQATSGFYSDINPTFDPDGEYLYLMTNRSFTPVYSDFDNTWTYPNATQLAAIALRADVESLLAAENDTVAIVADTDEDVDSDEEGDAGEKANEDEADDGDDADEEEDKSVEIEFEYFERRLMVLPPDAGNMGGLSAVSGKVAYIRFPNSGSSGGSFALKYYDLEEKEEKTVMEDINGYDISADGKKVLVRKGSDYGIVDFAADQKLEDKLAIKEMEMNVNPREEWMQIFTDAWRFQRDFFYDKDMHGVDWNAMREQYGALIEHCVNRTDVNFVLGELIGELNASHTYRGGGDNEKAKRRAVGYLGIDWEKEDGYFKVGKVIRGAEWDNEVRSPLDMPGVGVNEGEYILAVNGIALNENANPWAAFEGLADKTVELTVNSSASWDGARTVIIKTMKDERRLRHLAWIESNRKRVDEASNGKIGYIYVPNTGVGGQNELVRQFYGQWNKEGLIIDERFNSGGQIPDRFIELLNRKPLAYWDVRDGKNWQWPPVGHFGSMAMLINGWAGSGGDAFPDYFKKAGLGPLIGDRTWGGLIGISGAPTLIDGGAVTVPTFRMYNPDGTWFAEGHGVDPDIEILENPTELAKGIDGQLDRAIEEVLKSIKEKGPIHPDVPPKENRSRTSKS